MAESEVVKSSGESKKQESIETPTKQDLAVDGITDEDLINGDDALAALNELEEYTDAERAAVLRKIDFILLPTMFFTYFLQFLDKQALSYAAIMTIVEDTKLCGRENYSLLVTMFYIGMAAGEGPMLVGLQKLPVGKFTAINVFLWGVSLACMAPGSSFAHLAAPRFFLGFFEAVVGPAMMLYTATWWKRQEQPLRVGLWYFAQGIAITLGGLLAYGVMHIEGDLEPWRCLFLICGTVTAAWGIVLFFVLPDHILKAWWLSDRQRHIAIDRLKREKITTGNKKIKLYQIKEAVLDPKVWLIFLFCFTANWAPSVNAFGTLLIRGLGQSALRSTLLNMPAGGFNVVAILSTSYLCSTFKDLRCICMGVLYFLCLFGTLMLYLAPRTTPFTGIAGVWMSAIGPAGFTLSLSVATSNVAGHTKRVFVHTLVFCAFVLGNAIAPQMYYDREKPVYTKGIQALIGADSSAIFFAGVLYWYMRRENKKRDIEAETNPEALPSHDAMEGFRDKTDLENRSFRYAL